MAGTQGGGRGATTRRSAPRCLLVKVKGGNKGSAEGMVVRHEKGKEYRGSASSPHGRGRLMAMAARSRRRQLAGRPHPDAETCQREWTASSGGRGGGVLRNEVVRPSPNKGFVAFRHTPRVRASPLCYSCRHPAQPPPGCLVGPACCLCGRAGRPTRSCGTRPSQPARGTPPTGPHQPAPQKHRRCAGGRCFARNGRLCYRRRQQRCRSVADFGQRGDGGGCVCTGGGGGGGGNWWCPCLVASPKQGVRRGKDIVAGVSWRPH